jgi:hypothetical protein
MLLAWGLWRSFPTASPTSAPLDAPEGPGLYEIRRVADGTLVAFGHAESVAAALRNFLPGAANRLRRLFSPDRKLWSSGGLEYRTVAAASSEQARSIAERLEDRRVAFYRRRLVG